MTMLQEIKREIDHRQEWPNVSVSYLIDCYNKMGIAAEISDGKKVRFLDEIEK